MKIVFFNRFFFPNTSATSQMLADLAFHLASSGCEVHVVTTRGGRDIPRQEVVRGVIVHRVALAHSRPQNLIARAFAYGSYLAGARRLARELLRSGDVAVAKTDPPLLSSAIARIAARRDSRLVVWLQDLFPEVASAYGVPGTRGLLGALIKRIRDHTLIEANHVVTISESMAKYVKELGIAHERVKVIHNWADGAAIKPIAASENPLRVRWGLAKSFVVGYSGNLGRVHEFDTMLGAAALLRDERDIRFVVVGRGAQLEAVQRRATLERLNITFHPHQDRAVLSESLGAPDVHLCVLRPEFEGLVQPSKLYGIMAAGRPTIFVGAVTSETAEILKGCDAGIGISTGDCRRLASAILELRDDPARRMELGMHARACFQARYDIAYAMGEWNSLLGA